MRSLVLAAVVCLGQQGNPSPRYPDPLRAMGTEGRVTIQFTTDSTGRPDTATFHILLSTNGMFTTSVLAVLPQWHLSPRTTLQRSFVFLMQDRLAIMPADPTGRSVYITAIRPAGPFGDDRIFFEFQVTKQVSAVPGNPAPHYPDSLRAAGIQGALVVQFVVNTDSTPDMSTFKVLRGETAFTDAVKAALSVMRFSPAQIREQPVRQLVQMPFVFSIAP
jgi:TonB family protein